MYQTKQKTKQKKRRKNDCHWAGDVIPGEMSLLWQEEGCIWIHSYDSLIENASKSSVEIVHIIFICFDWPFVYFSSEEINTYSFSIWRTRRRRTSEFISSLLKYTYGQSKQIKQKHQYTNGQSKQIKQTSIHKWSVKTNKTKTTIHKWSIKTNRTKTIHKWSIKTNRTKTTHKWSIKTNKAKTTLCHTAISCPECDEACLHDVHVSCFAMSLVCSTAISQHSSAQTRHGQHDRVLPLWQAWTLVSEWSAGHSFSFIA